MYEDMSYLSNQLNLNDDDDENPFNAIMQQSSV